MRVGDKLYLDAPGTTYLGEIHSLTLTTGRTDLCKWNACVRTELDIALMNDHSVYDSSGNDIGLIRSIMKSNPFSTTGVSITGYVCSVIGQGPNIVDHTKLAKLERRLEHLQAYVNLINDRIERSN